MFRVFVCPGLQEFTCISAKFMKSLILYSSDGVGKSGLFCALCDIIRQMTYDRVIDVYMTVRHVQNVMPQAVASVVSGNLETVLYLCTFPAAVSVQQFVFCSVSSVSRCKNV